MRAKRPLPGPSGVRDRFVAIRRRLYSVILLAQDDSKPGHLLLRGKELKSRLFTGSLATSSVSPITSGHIGLPCAKAGTYITESPQRANFFLQRDLYNLAAVSVHSIERQLSAFPWEQTLSLARFADTMFTGQPLGCASRKLGFEEPTSLTRGNRALMDRECPLDGTLGQKQRLPT